MKNLTILFIGVFIISVSISCTKTPVVKTPQNETTSPSVINAKDTLPKPTETAPNTISGLVYGVKDIPKSLKYEGNVIAAAKWNDKNGENVIIITETEIKSIEDKKNPDSEPMQSKRLYGYHYKVSSLLWKIQDFVDKCPASLELTYIPNSLSITDLDNNGIAESTFLYMLGCRGDVSPVGLKLMMHENETKYVLRGETFIKMEGSAYGGEIKEVEPTFKKAPGIFLDYAKKQWEKFKTEKLED